MRPWRFWGEGEREGGIAMGVLARFHAIEQMLGIDNWLDLPALRVAIARIPSSPGSSSAPGPEASAAAAGDSPGEAVASAAPLQTVAAQDAIVPSALPLLTSFLTPRDGSSFTIVHQPGALLAGNFVLIDEENNTLSQKNVGDWREITSGDADQLVLAGGMGGMSLGGAAAGHERIVVQGGFDYSLSADDKDVDAGAVLTLSAGALEGGNRFDFDGSAELDGSFAFEGGAGSDRFIGGSGDDDIFGAGGSDQLTGGGGADIFHYGHASESTGAGRDTIDLDYGEDALDLPGTVKGLDPTVSQGSLSAASFDADLAAALGAARLGAGHAAWFTPDAGDLAGKTFLVVDANGQAGYQPGEDFVFEMAEPPPPDLSGAGFIV
jgi:hypothetical protein